MSVSPAPDEDAPEPPSPDAGAANRALVLVSLSVLLASSTWLSGTAAAADLRADWSLSEAQSAWLTISVQLGFLAGTFLYSASNLADVFNPRRVFLVSALLGAAFNAAFAGWSGGLATAVAFRFLTGLTLAGVYPVGMKIIASWFREGLGWRLGVMVGALTLGTACPYLVKWWGAGLDWRLPVGVGSGLAVLGGILLVTTVPDGPHLRGRARFDLRMMWKVFRHPPFRATACGYFGHMWELYAFWTLLSSWLGSREGALEPRAISLAVFVVIGAGVLGCVGGGFVSRRVGERPVALLSLVISAAFCATSGWLFQLPDAVLLPLLFVWGVFVVADSPQFSALAARHCPPEYTGTALTVQNGVGFAISVGSIQLLPLLAGSVGWRFAFAALTIGPLLGAWSMIHLGRLERPGPERPSE